MCLLLILLIRFDFLILNNALPNSAYDIALIRVVLPTPLREPSPPISILFPSTRVSPVSLMETACVTFPTERKFLIVTFLIVSIVYMCKSL